MHPPFRSRTTLVLLLPLLAACQQDQFLTPGTWQPGNLNEANLREMLANPHDLVAGASASDSRGEAGAIAVDRLVKDKTRPLPGTSTSSVGNMQAPTAATGATAAQ